MSTSVGIITVALIAQLFTLSSASASPAYPPANCSSLSNGKNYSTMFVQTGDGLVFTRKGNQFTVTISHASFRTMWFNDRPSRVGGSDPTTTWLKGVPATKANPINAAIVVSDPVSISKESVLLVELWDGKYDKETHVLKYNMKPLPSKTKFSFFTPASDAKYLRLPPAFPSKGIHLKGGVSVFLDDCDAATYRCTMGSDYICQSTSEAGEITDVFETCGCITGVPMCYQHGACSSCRDTAGPCEQAFGSQCYYTIDDTINGATAICENPGRGSCRLGYPDNMKANVPCSELNC